MYGKIYRYRVPQWVRYADWSYTPTMPRSRYTMWQTGDGMVVVVGWSYGPSRGAV